MFQGHSKVRWTTMGVDFFISLIQRKMVHKEGRGGEISTQFLNTPIKELGHATHGFVAH